MAQRKVGIKDIAARAGVSISTVSHVINGTAPISDEVRDRVIRVARDVGYLDRRKNKGTIASLRKILLAIPQDAMPENDVNLVSWTILSTLMQESESRGIRIVVHEIDHADAFRQVPEAARAVDADGIILVNDDRPALLKEICNSKIPAVLINGEDPEMHINSVTPGNRFAAQKATQRLIELGHRRIIHLTWQGRRTVDRRLDGFHDAFQDNGLDIDGAITLIAEGYEPRHAEAAVRDWLARHPDLDGVTAIFCAADNLAFGAMKALKSAGLTVPDDVSVMGFDGVGLGELHVPALSTVIVPLDEFGSAALELLESSANADSKKRAARRLELGCEVVTRASVGPPPR
ncbi:LacI family DNA-binding transcriptional regulator [Flavimaricola marinus]|uniref:HTH-type transcriptional regulator DegA n=1 Tax=Flavimaricola marinus TaxID=1819565 RepID=A0A238LCX7_9RHOB|nr:LacI family DNA-binding transcriptional regulator [Flavimaricola marinus]SMY07275.1 HTH-type transcriptional regulator DegA [Flavimaricola marinus]